MRPNSVMFTKMKHLRHLTVVVFKNCLSDWKAKIGLLCLKLKEMQVLL